MKNIKSGDLRTKTIDKYTFCLSDLIGEGFSSKVYKGINEETKQVVAVKVLNIHSITKNPLQHQLVKNQIKILRLINNENLIKCHQVFVSANNYYIVMELCQEGNLQNLLNKKGRFSQKQGLLYVKQILHGYYHLKQCGILHRDLKPSNVFLKQKQVKIGDFGFSQFQNLANQDTYKVGSPLYMAPETLQNYMYSRQGDIWSLGVLLYEIFQGRAPWQGKTQKQLIQSRNNGFNFRISLKKQLQILIGRCLTTKRQERISLEEMIAKVDALIEEDKQNQNTSNIKQNYNPKQLRGDNKKNNYVQESPLLNTPTIITPISKMIIQDHNKIDNNQVKWNELILKTCINLSRFTFKTLLKVQSLQISWLNIKNIRQNMMKILFFLIKSLQESFKNEQIAQKMGLKKFILYRNNEYFKKIYAVITEYLLRYNKLFTENNLYVAFPELNCTNICMSLQIQQAILQLIQKIAQIPILNSHLIFQSICKQNTNNECFNFHNVVVDHLISLSYILLLTKNEGYCCLQKKYLIDLSQIINTPSSELGVQDLKELQKKKKFLEENI